MHSKYAHKLFMALISEDRYFYFLIYNIRNIFFLSFLQKNTLFFPSICYLKGNKYSHQIKFVHA